MFKDEEKNFPGVPLMRQTIASLASAFTDSVITKITPRPPLVLYSSLAPKICARRLFAAIGSNQQSPDTRVYSAH